MDIETGMADYQPSDVLPEPLANAWSTVAPRVRWTRFVDTTTPDQRAALADLKTIALMKANKLLAQPADTNARDGASATPANDPWVDHADAVFDRLGKKLGLTIDRSARHETTPRHHSTSDIHHDFEDVAKRQELASDLDAVVRSGSPTADCNRIADLYLDRHLKTEGKNPLDLEAAAYLFTHSAMRQDLNGLAGLYDCYRHGAKIDEERYAGLFQLIDYNRLEPGAMAKPAYINLATAIGTPPGYTGENPEDTVVTDDVTALANQVWDHLSRKHYKNAQFERRATTPTAASAPG